MTSATWPQLSTSEPITPDMDGETETDLLNPEQLLAAIAGHLDRNWPLVRWARELGDLHAALIHGPHPSNDPEARHAITRVIGDIDSWAVFHLPRVSGARRHTHTLGQVISHVAKTFAEVWWTVLHTDDQLQRHEAWFHLGPIPLT